LFTTLLQRLTRTLAPHEASRPPRGRRAARPRGFVPQLTALEDRSLPSVAHGPLPHLLHHHGLVKADDPSSNCPSRSA
jgi:hypothetical protein